MKILISTCLAVLFHTSTCFAAGVYLDFNDFPATTGTTPSNSPTWEYSSRVTNNYGYTESASSGWKSKTKMTDGWHWFHDFNRTGACTTHMYSDTYGYLDITANGHSGKALRNTITGGLKALSTTPCGPPQGAPFYNRESYTGTNQIYTGGKIGHSYLYFKKINVIGSSRDTSPYTLSLDSNRLTAYIYLPAGISNGVGGYGNPVQQTYQAGVFQDPNATGYHHYHNFLTQGGGWTKIQIDETTNGDNGGNGATRHIPNFLKTIWQFYFTTQPYSGIATPPYEVLIDDIEFVNDTYVNQNNETISNLAILYRESDKSFEISINDKYKNSADAHATYELRYSLSGPITNENWPNATPVAIQADSRFYIQARLDGKFQKWWPYFQGVWAPFKLSTQDNDNLQAGQTIYFAVKDISQTVANLAIPVNGINGYWGTRKGGRPYDLNPTTFDFNKDKNALPFIKRISYKIAGQKPTSPTITSCTIVNKN